MLNVLVVDDEAVARRRIRRLLAPESDVAIVGECADGRSAIESILTCRPGVVFLDVQMPELDGFAVVEALPRDALPVIVFVTAFDRYALRAFDVHALDYLLKPFTPERFRLALARARERVALGVQLGMGTLVDELRPRFDSPERVAVRAGARTVFVEWANVDWIEGADNYVTLHVGPKEYLVRATLASLERRLDPRRFVRIHRSTIVRVAGIAAFERSAHGDRDVRLRDGTCLASSRTFRGRLDRALGISGRDARLRLRTPQAG